ncbi:MAG TPA: TMEM175 family protein [Longimicrobiaceae bacterium]|nr:TMEM175 family protein [Longimicrobiaceae bacterium]
MIREHVFIRHVAVRDPIRWRGGEVSRLEALSDAVFGFAITLLVVSLEVPRTYAQLMDAMRGFVAFAASFAILFLVWFHQYRFFRRYGLQDGVTVLLNAVLLFVVVFFVYPLKFVFTLVIDQMMGSRGVVMVDGHPARVFTEAGQSGQMMVVFSLGYVAVFGLFALMHVRAARLHDELGLSPAELFATRGNVVEAMLNVGIGVLSVLVARVAPPRSAAALAGLTYMLVGPVLTANGFLAARRLQRLGLEDEVPADAARARAGPVDAPPSG